MEILVSNFLRLLLFSFCHRLMVSLCASKKLFHLIDFLCNLLRVINSPVDSLCKNYNKYIYRSE